MMLKISYPLERRSPLYLGTPPVTIEEFKSINRGDSTNSSIISIFSHIGTHIDAPCHFCPNGSTIMTLLKEDNIYNRVCCLKIPKPVMDSVRIDDFAPQLHKIPRDTQVILVQTGFYKYRYSDKILYTSKYPWIDPAVPGYLRQHCPNLILFGIDTISISNPNFKKKGHDAHRSFLCAEMPILILEDVNLSSDTIFEGAWCLRIFPWIIDGIDGVPVFAFMENIITSGMP